MFSPTNIHKKEEFSNDFLTINNTIQNIHYSKSRIKKNPNNPQSNKLLRLIQINPFQSSDRVTKSPINTKNNISEISSVKYIPKRLANVPGFSMELPLKLIGRTNLDCKRLFGDNINVNNKKENKEEKENNYGKNEMNIKDNSFRNEYIYKFSIIANNFNKLVKYSEFISSENQSNFNTLFSKIKELLKKQPHLFFENNSNNNNSENIKTYENDLKSGFLRYRSNNIFTLPKINSPASTRDEEENISKTEQNSVSIEQDNINKHKISSQWYEVGSLMNQLLIVILGELRDYKYSNKKLNQKITEYEIKLANNNKEIENMKKFLNKYEVSSKIYLKIKNEKELEKVKASFNQKENQYILSIYKLEEEIKTLTTLLEHNQKYYHECQDLQKEIDIGKKKNEELKFMFNQEMHDKNVQKAIERENEEDLMQKMENLNEIIEDLKKEGEKRRKNDIENQIKIKKLNMNLDEKKENILMMNEELEWYIRELNKTKNDLKISKIDLTNLENVILNKIKEKEKVKGKEVNDNNENENNQENEVDESVPINSNNNYNNYSLDVDKDKDKSNSDIPLLNLSLISKNSPKSKDIKGNL